MVRFAEKVGLIRCDGVNEIDGFAIETALAIAVERARAGGRKPRAQITPWRSEPGRREQLEGRLRELSDEEIDALLKTALAGRTQASSPLVDL